MGIEKDIQEMAKEIGFSKAVFLGEYDGKNIYRCQYDSVQYSGWPLFILEQNGAIKFSSPDETQPLMEFQRKVQEVNQKDIKQLKNFLMKGAS